MISKPETGGKQGHLQSQMRLRLFRKLLIALFPVALFAITNHYVLYDAPFATYLFLALFSIFLIFAQWLIDKGVNPNAPFDALFSILVIFMFSFETLNFVFFSDLKVPLASYAVVHLIAFISAVIFALKFARKISSSRTFDVVIVLIVALVLALNVTRFPVYGEATRPVAQPNVPNANIYYFIFDAHPGLISADGSNALDDPELLRSLASSDFQSLEPGRSNYAQTRQTLAAIFDLNYLPEGRGNGGRGYPYSVQEATPPRLSAALSGVGYEMYTTRSAVFGCLYRHARCISIANQLDLNIAIPEFMGYTPLRRWKRFFQSVQAIDSLKLVVARQKDLLSTRKPFFVFVHHLAPHPPYFYSKACKREPKIGAEAAAGGWSLADKPAFAAETKCLNKDIAQTVRTLLANDPEAMIVLQSDHGPWFGLFENKHVRNQSLPSEVVRDRLSFLNQVRIPERCRKNDLPRMGQINTARLVVACATRKPLKSLEEKSYFTNYFTGETVTFTAEAGHSGKP